ncbi:citrate lyase holo-[acyl-carrier protein] synthase [Fusibacter bizertensis]
MNYLAFKEQKEKWIIDESREGSTILTIRVNVPGKQKKYPWSSKIHKYACEMLEKYLVNLAIAFERIELKLSDEYYEYIAFYRIHELPLCVKKLAIALENEEIIGRLLDLDVYDAVGKNLSRDGMNIPTRKCYLCDEAAFICGRSHKHSIEALHQFMILKAEMLGDKKVAMEGII